MSLPSIYKSLYRKIKERETITGIRLTPDTRLELMRLYFEQAATPFFSQENIFRIIENFPRPGVTKPRSLTHFTGSERRSRAKRSKAVREAVLEDLIYVDGLSSVIDYYNEAYASGEHPENRPDYSRQVQALFRRVPAADGPAKNAVHNYNRMVSRLFDDNPLNREAYLLERIRASGRSREQEEAVLRQERMQVILDRMASCAETLRNLDELSDPALSPDELASNYRWIREASILCVEIDNFKDAYPFTPEQKQQLENLRDYQYLCDTALGRMHAIANPVYEYLDTDALDDYLLFDPAEDQNIYTRYTRYNSEARVIDGQKAHEADVLRDYAAKHPDLRPFLMNGDTPLNWVRRNAVKDDFEIFMEDYLSIQNGRMLIRNELVENTKREFGFDGGDEEQLRNGHPIVFEKNNRVVILSPGKVMGGAPSRDTPEELFNHTLLSENKRLKEKLNDADPLWMKSSPQFKAMKERLASVSDLPLLKKGDSLSRAFSAYRDLLTASETYLLAKKDGQTKDEARSSRERERVQAAREIRDYARTKLKELELVEAARQTLSRFRGKSPEEKARMAAEEDIIAENAQAFREQQSDRMVSSRRRDQPFPWLKEQIDTIYKEGIVPERVRNVILQNYITLNTLQNGNMLYQHNTMVTGESAAALCGSLIAAELILQERSRLRNPGKPGPVETFFSNSNTSLSTMTKLGRQTMTSLVGRDYLPHPEHEQDPARASKAMTGEQLKEFMESFQPRELAEQFTDSFLGELGISPILQQLTGQYTNSVKPLRGDELDACEQAFTAFTKTAILDPMENYIKDPASGGNISAADSRKILANGVICNLIQLERARPEQEAPGYLETMLKDNPAGIEALSGRIMESQDFRNLMDANAQIDGRISVRNMAKILDQITTPTLVRNTMRSLTASCAKNLNTFTDRQPMEAEAQKAAPAAPAQKA